MTPPSTPPPSPISDLSRRLLGMKKISLAGREGDENFVLPAGFRFHPSDEELIVFYLTEKVLDSSFTAIAIGEADLNKCEPWDLPRKAKMGGREWYFFSVRDRKYPTGQRTNRATIAGYWKATGKDKEILRGKIQIGKKKTLVFYQGRAPRGVKSNWVMHEYRLEGKLLKPLPPTAVKNEWVLCRVFQKAGGGKKVQIAGAASSELPPLMDASPNQMEYGEMSHVTCFSEPNQSESQTTEGEIVDRLETPFFTASSSSNPTGSYQIITPLMAPQIGNSQYADNFLGQDQFVLRMLMENNGSSTNPDQKAVFGGGRDFDADISSVVYNNNNNNNGMGQRSSQNQEFSSASAGPVDIIPFWKF